MTGRPGASLSASKPVTKSPSRLFLWSQRRVQLAWGIRVSGNPWRTFRVDPSRVDTVQHVEQIDGIGRIRAVRSEEHTSELQSLMRISYAVFCLTKKQKGSGLKRQQCLHYLRL